MGACMLLDSAHHSLSTLKKQTKNTIAGANKLGTHTAHAIGAPTVWRTTQHQTRLHDDMATYTPDTSTRKGTPTYTLDTPNLTSTKSKIVSPRNFPACTSYCIELVSFSLWQPAFLSWKMLQTTYLS
jgi:hypothetical protein